MARGSKMSEERKPETKRSAGRGAARAEREPQPGLQGPVWPGPGGRLKRELEERTTFSVSLTRSYMDKQQQWQRTTNLDEDDLLPAAKALDDVYTWIQKQRQHSRGEAFHELQGPARAANS